MKDMEAILEKTTKSDQKIAQALRAKVTEVSVGLAKKKNKTGIITLKIDNQALDIPKSAIHLLFMILDNMADGNFIALIPSDSKAEVSTQQAADLLGVSRPHVVGLLEKGEMPFSMVGTHRRIPLKELIEYKKKMKKNRTDKLDLLAAQAQELNMGY